MTDRYDLEAAMRMAQWERAKGELRAMVAMAGAYHSSKPDDPESQYQRFLAFRQAAEEFISEVNGEGWGE